MFRQDKNNVSIVKKQGYTGETEGIIIYECIDFSQFTAIRNHMSIFDFIAIN
jgi:hypothetical protein